jgi:hypothetical protein
MSVMTTLWEHRDFRGFAKTSNSGNSRYFWNRWGATNDVFSSMRVWGLGQRGNAYAFEHINFDGRFAALNVAGASASSWWSYFGDSFNDKVSSSLIVARESQANEIEVPLRQLVAARFMSFFDAQAAGTKLSRRGEPRIYGTFFPGYDTDKVFATVDQDLTVQLDNWADYDANVKYDVEFSVVNGRLRGVCRWSHVWVESGIFSSKVFDGIAPRLHGAKRQFTAAIQAQLDLFGARTFRSVYLLPGPAPDMNQFGFFANHTDDVVLVIVQ